MRCAPLDLELLDLFVRKLVRLEFPPGAECARISEGEIACFPNTTLGRLLSEAAIRHTENLARGDAIRFVARIVRGVKATVAFELPLFTGGPRQHAAFDAAEIAAEQLITGRCADGRAAAFPNDGQRPLVARAYVLVVTSRNGGNSGVQIFDGDALQVLRLIPLTACATGSCAMMPERATDPVVAAGTGQ